MCVENLSTHELRSPLQAQQLQPTERKESDRVGIPGDE